MGSKAFYSYRLLSRFAEVLPASAVRPVSRFAAAAAVKILPTKRRLVQKNLKRVTGSTASPSMVAKTFASYIRYWLEALRLPVAPRERLDALLEVENVQVLKDGQAKGKGVILALPHMGNWDIAGAWFVANFGPLTVAVETIEPPELFTWFRDFRASIGLNVVANDRNVGSALLKSLKANEAIALLCDRDVDGTGGDYEFFGEVTKLPKGPALLALRSGAVLVPVGVYENGAGYKAVFSDPIPVEREGTLSSDVDRITQALAQRLEDLIRIEPEQWHLFQPNWPSDR